MSDTPATIFKGLEDVINRHLLSDGRFNEHCTYRQKKSCIALSEKSPMSFNGEKFVADMYQCIEGNLDLVDRTPSAKNWKQRSTKAGDLRKPDEKNMSAEVKLERAIVEKWGNCWNYQMPVASGLINENSDKRRAVDLVFRHEDHYYDLVELKIKSDTPLYAAMEILGYGLVYLVSRTDRAGKLKYKAADLPVLRANRITLSVLAPTDYYDYKGSLKWLRDEINDGLRQFSTPELALDFRFESFDFPWTSESTVRDLPQTLLRELVWE